MASHSMDEIRKKRLARLAGTRFVDTSVDEYVGTDKTVSNCCIDSGEQPDVEMTKEPTDFLSCVKTEGSKDSICEKFLLPQAQLKAVTETHEDALAANFLHDKLMLMLSRVLSVRCETEVPDSPLYNESESNVIVRIATVSKQDVPDGPPDIRYYKSLCFDILSSALSQVRAACKSTISANDIKNNVVNFFQLEYLSNCVYQQRVEKNRLCSAKSEVLGKSFALELLNEVGCQLHRHVFLVLSGVLCCNSDGPSHVPGDLWLCDELVDSALLRLTVPCLLPAQLSLWALTNAITYRQPLSAVVVSGHLEPPPGSDDVLSNLFGELQLENATAKTRLDNAPKQTHTSSVEKIFKQLLMSLYFRIRRLSIDQHEYGQILSALVNLCNTCVGDGSRPVNQLIVQLPCWTAPPLDSSATAVRGHSVERLSFVGPFFSASIFADDDPSVVLRMFPKSSPNESAQQEAKQALQLTLDLVWDQQFALVKSLLSKSTRSKTLNYLTDVLCSNADHGKLQCDTRFLAGEGFMFNISLLFQRLSIPINVDSVDPRYIFHPACRLDLRDTTRINASNDDLVSFQASLDSELRANGGWPSWNFSTECFLLTAWAVHLGFQASLRKYDRRLQVISGLLRNVKLLNASRDQWAGPDSPQVLIRANELALKQYKEELERQERAKLCCDVILFYAKPLQAFGVYYASLSKFLLSAAGYQSSSGLSSHESSPHMFALMPEYFLEDIANYLIFVLKHFSRTTIPIDQASQTTLVGLVLFVICHGHFVRNPYLVAKFVEVLFFCDPAVTGRVNEFHNATKLHPLATSHLIGALIRLYISVESTGSTHEFYDKFSIRYNISTIFITWWHEGFLKTLFICEAETHEPDFIKFTNRMINDTSYLLEEALDGLKKIRELQDLRDDLARWSELSRDQQVARMGELNSHEQQVRSYLTLANQTVNLLFYLTSEIQGPFLRPQIVDKLAAMLNFNLLQLCGPRCSSLKVRKPESYGWAPKVLLAQLVSIYRHLDTDSGEFALAVAKDERCYSKELFAQAHSLMSLHGIQTPAELDKFARLGEKVEESRRSRAEVDYGDIPSEFCDTLIATLMEDPVMLPQSQAVVDRSTIMRHLLNQETDPFCRMPLKEEDLIPLPDLKARIASWKAEREAQWRQSQL